MPDEINATVSSLLDNFIKGHPKAQLSLEEESIRVDSFWGNDWFFEFSIQDRKIIETLNKISIIQEFDAIFLGKRKAEFFYGLLDPNDEDEKELIDRKFEVYIEGLKYVCEWKQPSKEYLTVVENIKRSPESKGDYANQLNSYNFYKNPDKLPEKMQKYYKDKIQYNFTVRLPKDYSSLDLVTVFNHINFSMRYYDRSSPTIEIREKTSVDISTKIKPIKYLEGHFPEKIAVGKLDENCLKLLDVARVSNPRQAFLYYYQIFEYAGYYYVEEKMKKKVVGLLKDPALINCFDDKIEGLLTLFSDLNHNDDVKMRRVIEECCDPDSIWKEVELRSEQLSTTMVFDGGFELKPLISKDISQETWSSMWMPKTFDTFTKIRNCIVHARERRENRVILPTESNTVKLTYFVPIIRRMAEQITIKTSV